MNRIYPGKEALLVKIAKDSNERFLTVMKTVIDMPKEGNNLALMLCTGMYTDMFMSMGRLGEDRITVEDNIEYYTVVRANFVNPDQTVIPIETYYDLVKLFFENTGVQAAVLIDIPKNEKKAVTKAGKGTKRKATKRGSAAGKGKGKKKKTR